MADEVNPKKLIRRLVEEAITDRLMLETHHKKEQWRKSPRYQIGGMITQLSQVERETIMRLTAEYCQDVRIDSMQHIYTFREVNLPN